MTVQQITKQYLSGLKMREQARQLSQKALAKKFERSRHAISKIANGLSPSHIPEDEQSLIRACIAERDRLKSEASKVSMPRLCHLHGIGHHAIEDELVRMGVWEEAA